MSYKSIKITSGIVSSITLNRPDVKNAFDENLIQELSNAANMLSSDSNVRVIILQGEGNTFCAGADINWMKSMANFTKEENLADSIKMAQMFSAIYDSPKPWIARVHGHAIGGGAGLVAVCDIALGVAGAKLGFPEVRLGIAPAVISPYVIERIGISQAKRYFLAGELMDASQALSIGLIDEVFPDILFLDQKIKELSQQLLKGAPHAISQIKELVKKVSMLSNKTAISLANKNVTGYIKEDVTGYIKEDVTGYIKEDVTGYIKEDVTSYTVETISNLRISKEGQEGLRAFLNKQKPPWELLP